MAAWPLAVLMTLFVCSAGCSSGNPGEISVDELNRRIKSDAEFFLVDVRTAEEYAASHIAATDDQIPFDQLNSFLDRFPESKQTTIYCFCRTGRRSGIAAIELRTLGYENVYNVAGGIVAWQAAGYEILTVE